jgi:hypothetical protein
MNKKVIDEVFSVYKYLKDSIRVTKRTIQKDLFRLHNRTLFLTELKDNINSQMDFASDELEDIMILALFASFERELRISIQSQVASNLSTESNILLKIRETIDDGIEHWAVNDIIDLFKGEVTEEVLGTTKQIYEYRNWVAHGKNKDKLPSKKNTDVRITYQTLISFIDQVKETI